ncbi:MAG: HAMP domain-containing protein, partial [Bdellovibrionota bacterium]
MKAAPPTTSLRRRILTFVGAFTLLSLLASAISVYRITEVNRLLDAINRVSVPLGRIVTQMQSDADILRREMERGLGNSHWKDAHWKPRPIPRWIEDVLESETDRVQALLKNDADWANPEEKARWRDWATQISAQLASLRSEASKLFTALDQKNDAQASEIYPRWSASAEEWRRELQWGALEYERSLRQTFSKAQSRVAELRTGLEAILVVVIGMSLLLLWLGERALRPLADLTHLAREITRRGLRKQDKLLLPEIPLSRSDEVSHLAREFHTMATALLERERTVESQKHRLQEQNRLLREIGELNENILHSIDSVLIVTDLEGKITQCNPVAARLLQKPAGEILGTRISEWSRLSEFAAQRAAKVGPAAVEGRVYGGQWLPLKQEDGGAILVLDDLTEELDLQERLRSAENLAAVGRMSAQVAHEVRNPL